MTGRLGKASPRTRARLTGVVYLLFFATAVLGAVVALLFLNLNVQVGSIALVFFGVFQIVLGYLIFKTFLSPPLANQLLTPLAAVGGSARTVWGGNSTIKHLLGVRLASVPGTRRVALFIAKLNKADLLVLQKLHVERKIAPVIDRCYELNRVREAFNYMGEGHAQGKVIINV